MVFICVFPSIQLLSAAGGFFILDVWSFRFRAAYELYLFDKPFGHVGSAEVAVPDDAATGRNDYTEADAVEFESVFIGVQFVVDIEDEVGEVAFVDEREPPLCHFWTRIESVDHLIGLKGRRTAGHIDGF